MNKIAFTLLLGAVFAMGCGDQKAGDGKDTKSAAATGTADKGGGSGDSIGIAECDDYIKKMTACLDKMPGEAKEASKKAMEDSKKAWKESAKAAKDQTQQACKTALDALAQNPACK